MNLVQFLILYGLTLIIVNFWIRVIILMFEMDTTDNNRNGKRKRCPRKGDHFIIRLLCCYCTAECFA